MIEREYSSFFIDGTWRKASTRIANVSRSCSRASSRRSSRSVQARCRVSSRSRTSRAALTAEPPVVARIAVHLSAGRAALAQRMLQAEARPPTVAAGVWALLLALAAWQAGDGPALSDDGLRRLALHFRSFRRSGFIESMSPSTTPSAGAAA